MGIDSRLDLGESDRHPIALGQFATARVANCNVSRVLDSKFRPQLGTLRDSQRRERFHFLANRSSRPTRHAFGLIKGSIVDFMKKNLLLILSALGLVALLPQRAKADGYFGISVGPAYPVYYGGYYQHYYYPHYYRQYYYYDNPYRYGYWRHHRRWHHYDDD